MVKVISNQISKGTESSTIKQTLLTTPVLNNTVSQFFCRPVRARFFPSQFCLHQFIFTESKGSISKEKPPLFTFSLHSVCDCWEV